MGPGVVVGKSRGKNRDEVTKPDTALHDHERTPRWKTATPPGLTGRSGQGRGDRLGEKTPLCEFSKFKVRAQKGTRGDISTNNQRQRLEKGRDL